METEEPKTASLKWLPSLKKPEYVGIPKTLWVDFGKKGTVKIYNMFSKMSKFF